MQISPRTATGQGQATMQVDNLAIGNPKDVPMALLLRSGPNKCPHAAALLQQAKNLSWWAVDGAVGGHIVLLSDTPPVLWQGFEKLDARSSRTHT